MCYNIFVCFFIAIIIASADIVSTYECNYVRWAILWFLCKGHNIIWKYGWSNLPLFKSSMACAICYSQKKGSFSIKWTLNSLILCPVFFFLITLKKFNEDIQYCKLWIIPTIFWFFSSQVLHCDNILYLGK